MIDTIDGLCQNSPFMEVGDEQFDWQVEHERFMTLVYPRTMKAAKRAFSGWHISKQTDAVASCIGKMWC